jgi:predicted site-specific integrase-resolvase
MKEKHVFPVVIKGKTYLPLARAAEEVGVSSTTLKRWTIRGADANGTPLHSVTGRKGEPLLAAEDVARLSKLKTQQWRNRYDQEPITIDSKRYYAASAASILVGVSRKTMTTWLHAGNAMGFDLEVIRSNDTKRRLVSEESVFALAAIRNNSTNKERRVLSSVENRSVRSKDKPSLKSGSEVNQK